MTKSEKDLKLFFRIDPLRFREGSMEATTHVSTNWMPATVWAGIHLASGIGAVEAEIKQPMASKEAFIKRAQEIISESRSLIMSWQDHLNVAAGSPSKDSLLTLFALVSAGVKLFEALCQLEEERRVLPEPMRKEFLDLLADCEDTQDNLAILIDDEAREELQGILNEAGIDVQLLEQVDGNSSRPAATD